MVPQKLARQADAGLDLIGRQYGAPAVFTGEAGCAFSINKRQCVHSLSSLIVVVLRAIRPQRLWQIVAALFLDLGIFGVPA